MRTEGRLKWWWHDTCLRAVSSHRLKVLHHSRREKGSICTNWTRITPKWDWAGGSGTRDGRWAGNMETDAVRCSLPTQKVVMWVFTASHVRKFSTESVGWKTPAPQLRPSQAKFLWPYLGCYSHLRVPQYTLSFWQLQKRCNLMGSPPPADDTEFSFNKLEEFWIMEQSNHLITNLFSNRLLEFVFIKSFLILLKIIFNILHHLNFPISAETTSAPSHKSLAWFDACIPSYFLEDASYFIRPDLFPATFTPRPGFLVLPLCHHVSFNPTGHQGAFPGSTFSFLYNSISKSFSVYNLFLENSYKILLTR